MLCLFPLCYLRRYQSGKRHNIYVIIGGGRNDGAEPTCRDPDGGTRNRERGSRAPRVRRVGAPTAWLLPQKVSDGMYLPLFGRYSPLLLLLRIHAGDQDGEGWGGGGGGGWRGQGSGEGAGQGGGAKERGGAGRGGAGGAAATLNAHLSSLRVSRHESTFVMQLCTKFMFTMSSLSCLRPAGRDWPGRGPPASRCKGWRRRRRRRPGRRRRRRRRRPAR